MIKRIALTQNAFRHVAGELARSPDRVITCPAGVSRFADQITLLVGPVNAATPRLQTVLVCGADRRRLAAVMTNAHVQHRDQNPAAIIGFGLGPQSGDVGAFMSLQGRPEPLDEIVLVDAGLARIRFSYRLSQLPETSTVTGVDREVWSRTIGALGEEAWRRLTDLHFGLVGCGRSGMEMATTLVGLGVHHLTLIDADTIELSNIGEIFPVVSPEDIGRPKAQVLARILSGVAKRRIESIHTVLESISSQPALIAAKAADVLICCVDNPAARAATAFLSKIYLKPLLDIGTGIHRQAGGGGALLAADVRLVLPDRCLLCYGGIRRIDEAREEFRRCPEGRLLQQKSRLWHAERAGSLRSLNMLAVSLATRLLEDFAAQRVQTSRWIQAAYGNDGQLAMEYPEPEQNATCPMCRFTAHGDDGLSQFHTALGIQRLP